jgi:GlpG protein
MQQQYWRLLTPIFLHFSLLHIVFNMLWVWDLGRRVELVQGRVRLLLVVVVIGVVSNIVQARAQTALFGGMSGVDYGLLGYCWIWGWLRRDPVLQVPMPVMIAMLAVLLLSMTGIMSLLGAGAIANAAHLGGLAAGLVLGLATVLVGKKPT